MKKKVKFLWIGIDALTNKLVKTFEMPALNKLMEESSYGELTSLKNPLSGPCWTTKYTGKLPKDHKVTSDKFLKANFSFKTIKNIFDEIDKKYNIGMFMMPMTWAPKNFKDGWCVSGFPSPIGKEKIIAPKELANDIPDQLIEHTASYFLSAGVRITDDFIKWKEGEEYMLDIFKDLIDLKSDKIDVLCYGTVIVDRFGHVIHPSKMDSYRKLYHFADNLIEYLLEIIEPEHLIITSDHGNLYGHSQDGFYLVKSPKVKKNYENQSKIIQVAPTILKMLDMPIPKFMEKPIEVFK